MAQVDWVSPHDRKGVGGHYDGMLEVTTTRHVGMAGIMWDTGMNYGETSCESKMSIGEPLRLKGIEWHTIHVERI
jgi:hypothetical protein